MHSQAIASVIADELCQQHELYSVLRLAPSYDRSQAASNEEWEKELEKASKKSTVSLVRVLTPESVVHRCYTVYQSCIYRAVAREQLCEFADERLFLHGKSEKHHFVLHLSQQKPPPSQDPALADYRELASAHQMSKIEQDVHKAHIQLDKAIEAHLLHVLAWGVKQYAQKSSAAAFHDTAHRMAETCVQEIGNIILGALGTTLPAYAAFLGVLHWSGEGYEAVIPAAHLKIRDHLRMPARWRAADRHSPSDVPWIMQGTPREPREDTATWRVQDTRLPHSVWYGLRSAGCVAQVQRT